MAKYPLVFLALCACSGVDMPRPSYVQAEAAVIAETAQRGLSLTEQACTVLPSLQDGGYALPPVVVHLVERCSDVQHAFRIVIKSAELAEQGSGSVVAIRDQLDRTIQDARGLIAELDAFVR